MSVSLLLYRLARSTQGAGNPDFVKGDVVDVLSADFDHGTTTRSTLAIIDVTGVDVATARATLLAETYPVGEEDGFPTHQRTANLAVNVLASSLTGQDVAKLAHAFAVPSTIDDSDRLEVSWSTLTAALESK